MGEIAINESSSLSLGKLEIKDNGYPLYGADGLVGMLSDFKQAEDYVAIIKDGSGYGKVFYYTAKTSILSTMTYIKVANKEKIDLKWVYYLLQGIDFDLYKKGSGIPHIYFSDYDKQIVFVPPLPEQRKIASCLSAMDETINAYTEKVGLLGQYKKGLMQQMFPQNQMN